MNHRIVAATLLATISAPALALPADFKARADAIIAEVVPEGGPGVSVVITENGRIAYRAERGLADIEGKVAIVPATSFRFASVTKQFTAAAIMKLVDQRKVSLDDPLTRFLPDYPGPGGAATVRQLLNHTSGIMPYTQIPSWAAKANSGASSTTQGLIDEFKYMPLQFKVGEKYEYNNSGYVLLGAILEKVTGKSWDEAVTSLATGPLGLNSIKSGVHEAKVSAMATGYSVRDGKQVPSPTIHMSQPHAAGALIGTADDLARWGNAFHQGKVVSPDSYAAMTSASKLSNGEATQYGFGLAPSDVRGRKTVGHNGNIHGFATSSLYVAAPKIFIAVLSNSDSLVEADVLATRLAAEAIGDPFPVFTAQPLDMKAVAPLLGLYALPVGERRFLEREGKLYTLRSGGGEREVFPIGGNRFFYGKADLTWFEIKTGADGEKIMAMHHNGATDPELAKWSGPIPPDKPTHPVAAAMLDTYVGTYSSPIGTFLITRNEGILSVKLGDQPALATNAISDTSFEVAQVGAEISFGDVTNGKAQKLMLKQGGQTLEAMRAE